MNTLNVEGLLLLYLVSLVEGDEKMKMELAFLTLLSTHTPHASELRGANAASGAAGDTSFK